MPRIAVILVNWRRPSDTLKCIENLAKINSNVPLDLFVCDNHSPDDSHHQIVNTLGTLFRTLTSAAPPWISFKTANNDVGVHVLQSPSNLGFAGGNNFAYNSRPKDIEYTHYWFLNNDTEVDPSCLDEMLRKFNHPTNKIGIVGSTMVYFHDKKTVQALGGSVYKPWSGTMREIGNGLTWPCEVDEAEIESKMSYVCGASMLVSAELIRDVGLMRDDYFLFFEEIDWCERARKAGYSLAYASKAIVYHKEGAAIGTGTGATRSLLAEYYGMRNKLLVTWRFFPWAFPSVWLISWLQVLRRLLQKRPANAWLMTKTLWGLGKKPT